MDDRARTFLMLLQEHTNKYNPPMVSSLVKTFGKDSFIVLISCLISLRAKDTTTLPICITLFSRVRTPEALLAIPVDQLEQLLYSVGFYRNKAQVLRTVCQQLLDDYQGIVPDTEAELLKLHGVGRKTANLVLAEAFDVPAICVDTHVHRLANHFGIVATKTPEETEIALQRIFEPNQWRLLNRYLVVWGQNICRSGRPGCFPCRYENIWNRLPGSIAE